MKDEVISLNKKDFLKVLKNWEIYTSVYFKKLAKNMPTTFEMDSYHRQHTIAPVAESIKLSDLSELLWKSFALGADKVDDIHDENFVAEQVEYFRERFSDAETIAENITYMQEMFDYYESDEPMKSFTKMGKLAQLKIIQEGLLETATENFRQGERIIERQHDEARIQHQEWYKKNNISLELKKEIRAKDKDQCVYCGRTYNYHSFTYLKTNDEIPETDNVLLICKGCLSKKKKGKISVHAFGRFSTE